jgi:hypothetical protein
VSKVINLEILSTKNLDYLLLSAVIVLLYGVGCCFGTEACFLPQRLSDKVT